MTSGPGRFTLLMAFPPARMAELQDHLEGARLLAQLWRPDETPVHIVREAGGRCVVTPADYAASSALQRNRQAVRFVSLEGRGVQPRAVFDLTDDDSPFQWLQILNAHLDSLLEFDNAAGESDTSRVLEWSCVGADGMPHAGWELHQAVGKDHLRYACSNPIGWTIPMEVLLRGVPLPDATTRWLQHDVR